MTPPAPTAIFTSVKPVTANGDVVSDSFRDDGRVAPIAGSPTTAATPTTPLPPTPATRPTSPSSSRRRPRRSSPRLRHRDGRWLDLRHGDAERCGSIRPAPSRSTSTARMTRPAPDGHLHQHQDGHRATATYVSDSFASTAAGTYRWIANYSGDAQQRRYANGCNESNESVVVTPAAPTVVTQASASVTVGGAIFDTATLAGGVTPTGTITSSSTARTTPTAPARSLHDQRRSTATAPTAPIRS